MQHTDIHFVKALHFVLKYGRRVETAQHAGKNGFIFSTINFLSFYIFKLPSNAQNINKV